MTIEQGDLVFDIDGAILQAGPGTTVFMPRGVPHTFRVKRPGVVPFDVPPVMDEQRRRGTEVVGPPM